MAVAQPLDPQAWPAPQAPQASQASQAPQASQARRVEVSVVIVSYHCRAAVLACVERLVASRPARPFEVIVVDNGSTDGTVERLRACPFEVTVVPMGTNAGFARATNVGIRRAVGRHVLVLNPDTVVEAGAVDVLSAWLDAHPGAGAVGPRLLNVDGTDQRTARSFPTPAAAIFGRRSPVTRWLPANRWSRRYLPGPSRSGAEPSRVDWVSGAAMMVPASVIARVGSLDEGFFLFWEDADWCKRMAGAGLEVWTVPRAVVVHDEGGTRGHGWSARTVVHFHRGAYRYWRKHHAPQPWNPARWAAAGLLAGRALAVLAGAHLATVARGSAVSRRPPSTA